MPAIQELQSACEKAYIQDFQPQTIAIMAKASDHYADVAKQYDKTVFAKIQKELIASLLQLMFPCFDSQLKMLRQTTYIKVEGEVKKLERKELDEICENLSEIL